MNRLASALICSLLLPSVAFAAGGEHGGVPWDKIALHAVNFVILVGGLYFVGRTAINDAVRNRTLAIRTELDDAVRAKAEAQAQFDVLQARLDGFVAELATLRAEGVAESEREAEHIAERTKRDVELTKSNTERIIRDETARARVRLQQDAAELAVRLAEELLKGRMTGDDQSRLAREFLDVVNQDAKKETVAHG
ncbi:ATP synthase F0 subunit B [Myxococcota bacterium]|nr:ATP synthase F0 subunit B [Myxococcota bacterium]